VQPEAVVLNDRVVVLCSPRIDFQRNAEADECRLHRFVAPVAIAD